MEPPREIGRGRTLRYALVTSVAQPTAAGSAAALAVVKFPDEAAYYLVYLDASGNDFGDTWHANLDDALAQAEYEYPGIGAAWVEVSADEVYDPR